MTQSLSCLEVLYCCFIVYGGWEKQTGLLTLTRKTDTAKVPLHFGSVASTSCLHHISLACPDSSVISCGQFWPNWTSSWGASTHLKSEPQVFLFSAPGFLSTATGAGSWVANHSQRGLYALAATLNQWKSGASGYKLWLCAFKTLATCIQMYFILYPLMCSRG